MQRLVFVILFFASFVVQAQPLGESRYSKYFAESRLQLGPGAAQEEIGQFNIDLGIGVQFSYVPNRLGWYAGATYVDANGYKNNYLAVQGGVVYRLLDASKVDIQLYGGLTCGVMNLFNDNGLNIKPGLDVGIRFAPGVKVGRSEFAWTSATLGMTNYWDRLFLTFGFSTDITAILAVLISILE